ncbi:MAG: Indolepyruvate ferredoxin oxidoreductase, partial [Pseudomonadota bacterium]|nr:Indolepyruvate ferredoxin oxidoreductase [Pseudomonadota bacterium]
TRLATALLGDSIASNMFMLGYAWQHGLIPVSESAILGAIRLNGAAVEMNQQAFLWGRHAAVDGARVERLAFPELEQTIQRALETTLQDIVEHRTSYLRAYQNDAYAQRFQQRVQAVAALESRLLPGSEVLTRSVAKSYFKLLAYKDEYEVARLYGDGEFESELRRQFGGDFSLQFHLGASWMQRGGKPRKFDLGPWLMPLFRVLSKLRWLRGTRFDPFGWQADRRLERQLIRRYEHTLDTLMIGLHNDNLQLAAEIASLAEKIRGYGHIKQANADKILPQWDALLARFQQQPAKASVSHTATVRL